MAEFPPQAQIYDPPPPYSEIDQGGTLLTMREPTRKENKCDRLPLNAGCQVFGWINTLLHSTVFTVCIYGYLVIAQQTGEMPIQISIVMGSILVMAGFAILANVLLLIGVYKKNSKCVKMFVILYSIYISLVSFGLFKQCLLGQVDSKEFYETMMGILLAFISLFFGHRYYLKLKNEKDNTAPPYSGPPSYSCPEDVQRV